jgi:hypothetical protein
MYIAQGGALGAEGKQTNCYFHLYIYDRILHTLEGVADNLSVLKKSNKQL